MPLLYKYINKCFFSSRQGIRDIIVSLIPQGITVFAGLVTTMIIARSIGPRGLGEYALIISISSIVVGLSDLGIGQTTIRYAARANQSGCISSQYSIFRWAFRVRICIVMVLTTVAALIAPFLANEVWHDDTLLHLIYIHLLTGITCVISSIPITYYQSIQRFSMNAAVSISQTIIALIGILLITLLDLCSLENVIYVSVLSSIFSAMIMLFMVPRSTFFCIKDYYPLLQGRISELFKVPVISLENAQYETESIGSFAFYMFLSSLVVTLTTRADIWLMGYYLDAAAVGIYNVAMRFSIPLTMLLNALSTALFPRAAVFLDKERQLILIKKTFILSICIASIGAIYAFSIPLVIPIIFGGTYSSAILIGQLLCIRYCIALIICPMGIIGYSFGMIKVNFWINFIQLFVVIAVNVAFLPILGSLASALSLILNELVSVLLVGLILRRRIINN